MTIKNKAAGIALLKQLMLTTSEIIGYITSNTDDTSDFQSSVLTLAVSIETIDRIYSLPKIDEV